jgi:hypothetical protein
MFSILLSVHRQKNTDRNRATGKYNFSVGPKIVLSVSEFSCRFGDDREIILRQVYNAISVVLHRQENLVYQQKIYFPVGLNRQ